MTLEPNHPTSGEPGSEARGSLDARFESSAGLRLFSFSRSLGLAFALRSGAGEEALREMAKTALEESPRWLARNLHRFSTLGSRTIEALARELAERGHSRDAARSAGRSGLALGRSLGMQLAKSGAAAEIFLRAGRFGLDGPKELSSLAMIACASGSSKAIERAVRGGATLEPRVGLEIAKHDAGFVLDRLPSFGISKAEDISRICLAALDQRDPYAVLNTLAGGCRLSSEVVCRLVEESPRRFAYAVAKLLPSISTSDNEHSSRLAFALIDSGYERSLLAAQRAGAIVLGADVANRLLARRTAAAELGVIANLSLFAPPADRAQHEALAHNVAFLARIYGPAAIIEAQPNLSAPIWSALEPDLKLRTFAKARSLFPPAARRLADGAYADFREQGDELKAMRLLHALRRDLDGLIGRASQPDSISSKRYYRELMDYVFPDHSNGYTSFERNEENRDRTRDLGGLVTRGTYPLCAYARERLVRRAEPASRESMIRLRKELESIAARARDGRLETLTAKAGACPDGAAVETRIVAALMSSLASGEARSNAREALLLYRLSAEERPDGFFSRIETRANPSGSHPFCSLRGLETFLDSDMRRTAAKIARAALTDPAARPLLAGWYGDALAHLGSAGKAEALSRSDPAKLERGARFLARIERALDAPGLPLRERLAAALGEAEAETRAKSLASACLGICRARTAPEKTEAALRNVIRRERIRVARCLEIEDGRQIDPRSVDLASVGLASRERSLSRVGKAADPSALAAFVEIALTETFARDLRTVRDELAAYSPASYRGLSPIDCEGYFTKNHTAAHAPQAGGVCTTGEKGIWDTPTHFLFVLRDRVSKRCQGSVLCFLHEEGGRRMLSASFNPSSTYLMKVDQTALLLALKRALCELARANGIDVVGVSSEPYIRSNRLDTPFEDAIRRAVEGRPTIRLDVPIVVSREKQYYQHDLQVLWEAPKTAKP